MEPKIDLILAQKNEKCEICSFFAQKLDQFGCPSWLLHYCNTITATLKVSLRKVKNVPLYPVFTFLMRKMLVSITVCFKITCLQGI